jgi:S1-C subfamily serine protease
MSLRRRGCDADFLGGHGPGGYARPLPRTPRDRLSRPRNLPTMTEKQNWAFPENVQPKPEAFPFDLNAALDAVVMLRAEIPEDAFTASILGTERIGSGVVIRDDGLVLTMGYLITEADAIWLTSNAGIAVPATVLAYDQPTGFGLVQPLGRIEAPALRRGSAADCRVGDDAILAGHGGRSHALMAKIIARREFAGYWEYVLDDALFTAPAHPQWGGAALIDRHGRLIGIGSLLAQEVLAGEPVQGNMIVPVDLLEPILADMLRIGRRDRPPRPWLGMYTIEANGQLVVAGIADRGPADLAGVQARDVVLEVDGERPASLADLFRRVWQLGPAGTEVALTLSRNGEVIQARLASADRNDFLKKPRLH